MCLAGWATVHVPLEEQDYGLACGSGSRRLSPHSSCRQRDGAAWLFWGLKQKRPNDMTSWGPSRLRWSQRTGGIPTVARPIKSAPHRAKPIVSRLAATGNHRPVAAGLAWHGPPARVAIELVDGLLCPARFEGKRRASPDEVIADGILSAYM